MRFQICPDPNTGPPINQKSHHEFAFSPHFYQLYIHIYIYIKYGNYIIYIFLKHTVLFLWHTSRHGKGSRNFIVKSVELNQLYLVTFVVPNGSKWIQRRWSPDSPELIQHDPACTSLSGRTLPLCIRARATCQQPVISVMGLSPSVPANYP